MARNDHFHSMDGLRGFAAVAVVCVHTQLVSNRITGHHGNFFPGQLAVDFFFVLSGFVMSYSYLGRPIDWKQFVLARVARVYPLHVATCLVLLVLALGSTFVGIPLNARFTSPQEIVEEVFLLSALPGFSADVWNGPTWSICIEWWGYFTLFPFLAWVNGRISMRTATVVTLSAYALFGLYLYLNYDGPPGTTRGWVAVVRGMLGFAAGWAIWRLWRDTRYVPAPWQANLATAGVVFAWAISPHTPVGYGWFGMGIIPLFIFGLSRGQGVAHAFLSSRICLWLGAISYSIYLTHMIVLLLVSFALKKLHLAGHAPLWYALVVPITLAVSTVSYHGWEVPARDFIRSLGRRSRKSAGEGADAVRIETQPAP